MKYILGVPIGTDLEPQSSEEETQHTEEEPLHMKHFGVCVPNSGALTY
jgi:hypothetical protein